MSARLFTIEELACQSGCSRGSAELFVEGPEGFLELGLVVRVDGGYVVTERGRRLSAAVAGGALDPSEVLRPVMAS